MGNGYRLVYIVSWKKIH